MTDQLRVLVEVGTKGRRVVAAGTDWPGLDRWGADEENALSRLVAYLPRYSGVAERAGLTGVLAPQRTVHVIERYPGSSSTDFWGIAHVPSTTERQGLAAVDLEQRIRLLRACWSYFDATAARVSAELRPGPRGGGWTRDEIIRHVIVNEPQQFTRKVDVRTPREVVLTPDGLAEHRDATVDAIRAYHAESRPARTWPIPFLIRRIAHHVMDHAWEMEDRDQS
jgi:hypothetical protein